MNYEKNEAVAIGSGLRFLLLMLESRTGFYVQISGISISISWPTALDLTIPSMIA